MAESHSIHTLPTARQALLHITLLAVLAVVIGPLIGPIVVSWFNPTQAWGGQGESTYAPMNMLQWGLTMLMFEAFFYVGWLMRRARNKPQDDGNEWWNQQ